MSEVEGFGDPKHGSDRKGFPEGLKDGTQEHRILPPILAQVETGKYERDHTCHYGYGTKMNNSDKEFPNPFYCVEEGKFISGKFVVLQDCPECQEIRRVKAEEETIKADMKRAGNSDAEIAAATESHTKWLRKHNRDFKHYVNVKGADGRYFTVKYPSKNVWKPIKALIEKYKAQRIPIDGIAASQGLWFRITRSGKGFKTEYSVELVTEDVIVNGQVMEGASKPKLGPLTAEDARKARESCLDLGDVGIRRLSREAVARLVSSRGDPTVIQAIFAGSEAVTAPTTTRGDAEVESSPDDIPEPTPAPRPTPAPQVQAPTPAPTPRPVTAPPAGGTSQADLLAQARAFLEQARALGPLPAQPGQAATPPPAVTQQPAPQKPTPSQVADAVAVALNVPRAAIKAVDNVPTPAPQAAPAAGQSAEDEFLKQFDFGNG